MIPQSSKNLQSCSICLFQNNSILGFDSLPQCIDKLLLVSTHFRVWMTQKHTQTQKTYFRSDSRHKGSRMNSYSRSRSFSVVVSSISTLSAERPREDPFRSNRRCMQRSVQNMLPITINRTCTPLQRSQNVQIM
jgi:hypothetical protein